MITNKEHAKTISNISDCMVFPCSYIESVFIIFMDSIDYFDIFFNKIICHRCIAMCNSG